MPFLQIAHFTRAAWTVAGSSLGTTPIRDWSKLLLIKLDVLYPARMMRGNDQPPHSNSHTFNGHTYSVRIPRIIMSAPIHHESSVCCRAAVA